MEYGSGDVAGLIMISGERLSKVQRKAGPITEVGRSCDKVATVDPGDVEEGAGRSSTA